MVSGKNVIKRSHILATWKIPSIESLLLTTITPAVRLEVLGLHPQRSQCDLLYNLQRVFSHLG